jgi:cytochrome bd-type quinol oxidase subunit 2
MAPACVDRGVKWMRRIARVLSLLIIGIALIVLIMNLVMEEPVEEDYPPIENLLLAVMGLSILGLGLAWRWEGLGGAVCLGFFVVHLALYWAIRGRFFPLPVLLTFSPLPIAGLLFLACWWRSRPAEGRRDRTD